MIFSFTSFCLLLASMIVPVIYFKKYSNDEKIQLVKNILVSLGYESIYYFSVLQIKLNSLYKKLEPHINEIQKRIIKSEMPKTEIEIMCKDGTIKNKIDIAKVLHEIKIDDIKEHLDDNFELIVITSQNDKSNVKNKLCCTNVKNDISYDLSNIKFIDLSITHNNKTYNIDLKNDNHNFYIVNNTINKSFLKYYLANVLKLDVSEEFNYKLQLMDHEVNILHLDENHDIIIEKDSYRIEGKNNVDEITNIHIKGSVNCLKETEENIKILKTDKIEKEMDDSSDDFEKIDENKL
jgi:hypothetical protein